MRVELQLAIVYAAQRSDKLMHCFTMLSSLAMGERVSQDFKALTEDLRLLSMELAINRYIQLMRLSWQNSFISRYSAAQCSVGALPALRSIFT